MNKFSGERFYAKRPWLSYKRSRLEKQYHTFIAENFGVMQIIFVFCQQYFAFHYSNNIFLSYFIAIILLIRMYLFYKKIIYCYIEMSLGMVNFLQYLEMVDSLQINSPQILWLLLFSYYLPVSKLYCVQFRFAIIIPLLYNFHLFSTKYYGIWGFIINIFTTVFFTMGNELLSRSQFERLNSTQKSERSYAHLIGKSPFPVFVITANHRIDYLNEGGKNIIMTSFSLGNKNRTLGLNFLQLFEERDQEKILNVLTETRGDVKSELLNMTVLVKEIEEDENKGTESPFGNTLISNVSKTLSPQNGIPKSNSIAQRQSPNLGGLTNNDSYYKNSFVKDNKKLTKKKHFNLVLQSVIWKGKPCFVIRLEETEKQSKIIGLLERQFGAMRTLSAEILDLMEKDYQKWNNLQSMKSGIKDIKESDLKDLSSCVIENNFLRCQICNLEILRHFIEDNVEKNNVNFNIKNTLIQCLELVSVKAIEKKAELHLKFEEVFPESVNGQYENFKQLIFTLLRVLHVSSISSASKKPIKSTFYANLKQCYTERGQFLLEFVIEFERTQPLDDLLTDITHTKNHYMSDNTQLLMHLLKKTWPLEHLAIVTRLIELEAEFFYSPGASVLTLEIIFSTSELSIFTAVSPESVAQAQAVSSSIVVNKKPLSLSFCRLQPNPNNYIWKEKPAIISYPKSMRSKKTPQFGDFMTKTTYRASGVIIEKDRDNNIIEDNSCNNNVSHNNFNNCPQPQHFLLSEQLNKNTPSFECLKANSEIKEKKKEEEGEESKGFVGKTGPRIESKLMISNSALVKSMGAKNSEKEIKSSSVGSSREDKIKAQNESLNPEKVTYNRNSRKSISIICKEIKTRRSKLQQEAIIPKSSKKLINEILEQAKPIFENQIIKSIYQVIKLNHTNIDVMIKESENAKLRKEHFQRFLESGNYLYKSSKQKNETDRSNRSFLKSNKRLNVSSLMRNLRPNEFASSNVISSNQNILPILKPKRSESNYASENNEQAKYQYLHVRKKTSKRKWKISVLENILVLSNEEIVASKFGGAYVFREISRALEVAGLLETTPNSIVSDFGQAKAYLENKYKQKNEPQISKTFIVYRNEDESLMQNLIQELRNFEKKEKHYQSKIFIVSDDEGSLNSFNSFSIFNEVFKTILLDGEANDFNFFLNILMEDR